MAKGRERKRRKGRSTAVGRRGLGKLQKKTFFLERERKRGRGRPRSVKLGTIFRYFRFLYADLSLQMSYDS